MPAEAKAIRCCSRPSRRSEGQVNRLPVEVIPPPMGSRECAHLSRDDFNNYVGRGLYPVAPKITGGKTRVFKTDHLISAVCLGNLPTMKPETRTTPADTKASQIASTRQSGLPKSPRRHFFAGRKAACRQYSHSLRRSQASFGSGVAHGIRDRPDLCGMSQPLCRCCGGGHGHLLAPAASGRSAVAPSEARNCRRSLRRNSTACVRIIPGLDESSYPGPTIATIGAWPSHPRCCAIPPLRSWLMLGSCAKPRPRRGSGALLAGI
jgi:hypothetical protein